MSLRLRITSIFLPMPLLDGFTVVILAVVALLAIGSCLLTPSFSEMASLFFFETLDGLASVFYSFGFLWYWRGARFLAPYLC